MLKKKEINKRLKKRDSISVKILKNFQLPVELKKKKADFIIKNNFKSNSIKKNVKIVIRKILLNAWSYIRYGNYRVINERKT